MAVRAERDEVVERVLFDLRPRLEMGYVEAWFTADCAPVVGLNEDLSF